MQLGDFILGGFFGGVLSAGDFIRGGVLSSGGFFPDTVYATHTLTNLELRDHKQQILRKSISTELNSNLT